MKKSFKFVFSTKKLTLLLLLVILGSDAGYLASIFLPVIKTGGLTDYVSSTFIWIITFFSIVGALLSDKIGKKLGQNRALILLFSLKGLVYLGLYFLGDNIIFSIIGVVLVTFLILDLFRLKKVKLFLDIV